MPGIKLTDDQKKLLVIIGAIAFCTNIVLKNFIIQPRMAAVKSYKERISDNTAKLQTDKQLKTAQDALKSLSGKIKYGGMVEFADEVLKKLAASELEAISFAPKQEKEEGGLSRFIVEMQLACGYEKAALLIKKLEESEVFSVIVDELELSRVETGPEAANYATVKLTVSTVCFPR